jgi:hypothetical protein
MRIPALAIALDAARAGPVTAASLRTHRPRHRCGHDGQRKRVAHMPTATAAKEDSSSKMVQNYPHDFTKRPVLKRNAAAPAARSPPTGSVGATIPFRATPLVASNSSSLKAALGSKIEDRIIDIPEMTVKSMGHFDTVTFNGIFYYILDPISAIINMSRIAT